MASPIRLSVGFSKGHLEELNRIADPVKRRRILFSAINDASRYGETQVGREIRGELNLKTKAIKDVVTRTVTGHNTDNPSSRIRTHREPIPLRDYGARQTKLGVSSKVRKGKGRELLKSGFQVGTIGQHVFKREGKARLPINKRYGPTVVGVLAGKPGMLRDVTDKVGVKAEERLASKIQLHLERAAAQASDQ